jgi:hypothetical protein
MVGWMAGEIKEERWSRSELSTRSKSVWAKGSSVRL